MILAGLEHLSVLYDIGRFRTLVCSLIYWWVWNIGLFFKILAGLEHWSVLYDVGRFRTLICSL